jgi:hypothetical protein
VPFITGRSKVFPPKLSVALLSPIIFTPEKLTGWCV